MRKTSFDDDRKPEVSSSFMLKIATAEGCPHNECTFCSEYKGVKYRSRKLGDIRADLKLAKRRHGEAITAIHFPDANFISFKTSFILAILKSVHRQFPGLNAISCYGPPRYLIEKSAEDLSRLAAAGLGEIRVGAESGDEATLTEAKKGTTLSELVEGCQRVVEAGMGLAVTVMIGLGGQANSHRHAAASAELINRIRPTQVWFVATIPVPGTPLHQRASEGRFKPLRPYQALEEMKAMIEAIRVPTEVMSERTTGYLQLNGVLPEDARSLLQGIDYALTFPENSYEAMSIRCD